MHERLNGNGILIPGQREERPNGLVIPPRAFHQPAVEAINRNAEAAKDWPYFEIHSFLTRWTPILVSELVDPILTPDRENRPLPPPVISFEKYDYRILAGYRITRNAQGLLDQITFNTTHIKVEERKDNGVKFHSEWEYGEWFLLETYTHELLHLKQQNFGKHPVERNYHNAEYVGWAEQIGLHVNQDGQHTRLSDGAFAECMKRHGVTLPKEMPSEGEGWEAILDFLKWLEFLEGGKKKEGKSTLFKWGCPKCGFAINATTKEEIHLHCGECKDETGEDIDFVRVERKRKNSHQTRSINAVLYEGKEASGQAK